MGKFFPHNKLKIVSFYTHLKISSSTMNTRKKPFSTFHKTYLPIFLLKLSPFTNLYFFYLFIGIIKRNGRREKKVEI